MPDIETIDKKAPETKPAPKPAPKQHQPAPEAEKIRHKLGLVEILIFLLLAGVIFIFVFGLQQMKREKEQELVIQAKFEEVLPTFGIVAKAAKDLREDPNWGEWPFDILQVADTTKINTPEFKFTWSENVQVILTTTKEFGKEGIKVIYDVEKDSYSIDDPEPNVKPVIKDNWLSQ